MSLKLKRAYDPPEPDDGARILVDRLWPRGLAKPKAKVDEWIRDIAPSAELRKWFGHEPEKWTEFKRRYAAELKSHRAELKELGARARKEKVTLLFAARDPEHNNAVVLRDVLKG